ncbi:peptide/nickel transport system substrate-binding protein [Streptomyces sp. SAI-117]|uniref:ABC transporter substrate-binding protein n=1 Tax=Streptomyces sp. SAI-117 TaxID=2940546 RepID=UPI002474784E|nr:ABC transporter substrate-binding protein [Streptomyces sp. SAI-117]MDH6574199.1 peptide/nickel transport system substrate-binding protein [Streptomyces sp. SAI-117]
MSDPRRIDSGLSRRTFVRLTGASALGAGLLGTAGCAGEETIGGGHGGDVLTLGRAGPTVTLDPVHSSERESGKVCMQIFDTLIGFAPGTTELVGALAVEVPRPERSGKQYTFRLRRGVMFHDGTPFDAGAVVFNFDRWKNSKSPYHKGGGQQSSQFSLYQAKFGGFDDKSIIDRVEAVDPHTVRFHLKRVSVDFLKNVAIYPFSISSPTALKNDVENFWQKPVGTGPFKFVSWTRGSAITLAPNTDWWGTDVPVAEGGGGPWVEQLVFQDIPDETSRVAALFGGDISGADGLNPDDVPALRKMRRVDPVLGPPLNIGYLAMNCQKKPFTDVRVRRAVAHAINMPEIVKTFFGPTAKLASNPMPPTVPYFARDVEPYAHDPDRARSLLRAAGLDQGFEVDLWYMPVPRPYMPNGKYVAQAMQQDLARVGIKVNLVTREWASYVAAVTSGKHDMCQMGWNGDTGDPGEFMNIQLNSAHATKTNAQNFAYYKNPEMDRLLDQALSTVDRDTQRSLYRRAQMIFHRDVPWAPIAYAGSVFGMRENVEGFAPSPIGDRYNNVKLAAG